MKKLFVYTFAAFTIAACGNAEQKETGISKESVENPATASDPTAKPEKFAKVEFKTQSHDFGDILEHQKVETTYEFTNVGDVDLMIFDCQATCGCTVPEWPREPIKPGEKGIIKVVFDSTGKEGTNNKVVTVVTNTEQK